MLKSLGVVLSTLVVLVFLSSCGGAEAYKFSKAEKKKINKKYFPDINKKPKKWRMSKKIRKYRGSRKKGAKIFVQVKKKPGKPAAGNCAACHCAKGVKGCGNIGPKFNKAMVRKWKSQGKAWLYAQIADARIHKPDTTMPPTLPTKVLKRKDIKHLMRYLMSLK